MITRQTIRRKYQFRPQRLHTMIITTACSNVASPSRLVEPKCTADGLPASHRRAASYALLAVSAGWLNAAEPPAALNPLRIVSREFIYETAPFPECHASTIVATPRGLISAWFGGKKEKDPSVGIWLSRQVGGAWTAPVEIAHGLQPDGRRLPCWNPVLFQPPGAPLYLFYKIGPSPDTWWGLHRTSTDEGLTWSEPTRLPDGVLGPIKNKPVVLSDDTWLCPTSTETPDAADQWRIHFELSSDHGQTWCRVAPAASLPGQPAINAIQPSVLFHPGGRLQALGRTRAKHLFTTESTDLGRTWSPVTLLSAANPNAGTDALTLKDGRHVLVSNPVPAGRTPLTVSLSRDGLSWEAPSILEDAPNAEFSYPACIQTPDGRLHITYTWKRKKIAHIVLE
jgi:predicted neuraminidase